eukprot:8851435-Prorocentrum_lima.AAC.1
MHRLSSLTCPAAVSFTPLSPLFLSPEAERQHAYMAPHSEYVDDFVLRISAESSSQLQHDFTAASAAVLRAHALVGLP